MRKTSAAAELTKNDNIMFSKPAEIIRFMVALAKLENGAMDTGGAEPAIGIVRRLVLK